MRKKRSTETDEQRRERLEDNSRQHNEDANAAEDAIDAMVKRSIEKHGP